MSHQKFEMLRGPQVHRRLAVLATVVVGALGVSPAMATAAPVDQGRYHDTGSEVVDWCPGIALQHSWDVTGSFRATANGPDGLVHYGDNANGMDGYLNMDTGRAFSIQWTVNGRDLKVTDNGDGTLTILIQGSGGERWYDADGKLVLLNPGLIRYEILVDSMGTPTNPYDDEFIDFLGVVKGSTGRNDTDGRDFCADVALFTS